MNKPLFNFIWVFLLSSLLSAGWSQVPEATACYFIKNATVVVKPGTSIENANLVIRNGIIEEVGTQVKAPYDARVIEADSMYVYAGFIDALSNTGLQEKDKDQKESKPSSPGAATLEQAGFTPEVKASLLLDAKSKSIESMRKLGFVISHTVPEGYVLPGQGAIISLKESDAPEDLILRANVSSLAQLKTKRGVFPSTLIGAMSRLREVWQNTKIYADNNKSYDMNPVGKARPMHDPHYEAFLPVVNKQMPLFFVANQPKDIHRAITLQKEMGFDMILSEVKYLSPIQSMVSNTTPVLLSLDLPKEMKEDKKDKKKKDGEEKESDDEEKEEEVVDEEKKALLAAKKESYDAYMSQAKEIANSGRPYAFSYLGVKSGDIIKNVRRLIKAGLTEDQALTALTTNAASIIGMSKVSGTVEKGKMAGLVITDKPLFDEKSEIRYVFVEGQMTEMEKKPEKKKSDVKEGKLGNISGTWRYEATVMGETQYGNIFIEKNGDSYNVSIESDDEPGEVDDCTDVSIDGRTLTMKYALQDDGYTINLSFDLNFVNDDRFEGTVSSAETGSFPISADRRDRPDRSIH